MKRITTRRERSSLIAIMGVGALVWGPAVLSAPPAHAGFHKNVEKGVKGAVEGTKEAVTNPGRSAECAQGDTKVVKKIAAETVEYATKKWKISDLVTAADTRRAEADMYEFLKWKLGNPSAVCGQYVTAGYDHFKKAYGDEAAAALLGFNLPNEKGQPEFFIPPELVELRLAAQKMAIPIAAQALEKTYGIPSFISQPLLVAYVEAEAKALKRVGFNLPKKYDISNGLVQLTIDAKRNPEKTRANLQRVMNDIAKREGSPAAAGASAKPARPVR